MRVRFQTRPGSSRRGEQGHVLLTLLLVVALMTIFAATLVTSITFDIKRDREEEMIHRGVQYSRAIRAYYKKLGRYPMTLEDLESANKMRFLRKRYKDPLTGQDFRLLHFGEVKLALSGGFGGGTIPGASTLGSNGQLTSAGTPNGTGQNPQAANATGSDTGQAGTNPPGTDNASDSSNPGGSGNSDKSGDAAPAQTFGGAPIVGVASSSKKETIREYNHKRKYSEWQFVYDPTLDRGGLITTPYQPQLQIFGQGSQTVNQQTGTTGPEKGLGTSAPGAPISPVVTPNNFGNPNPPATPPDTPPQQQ
jgi:type II secretory pathway pseudopilin PulG